jgi:alpha-L-fucosidase
MRKHSRSIYGCTKAPAEFTCPPGCNLTYNPEKNRLYVHLLSYPYKHVVLPGKSYIEKVEYAQFLHDGSEILGPAAWINTHKCMGENVLVLSIPQTKPEPLIPVIEIFLKQKNLLT